MGALRHAVLLCALAASGCGGARGPQTCTFQHDGSLLHFDGLYVRHRGRHAKVGDFFQYLRFFPDGVVLDEGTRTPPAQAGALMSRANASRTARNPVASGCYRLDGNRIQFSTRDPDGGNASSYDGIVAGAFLDLEDTFLPSGKSSRAVFRWLREGVTPVLQAPDGTRP